MLTSDIFPPRPIQNLITPTSLEQYSLDTTPSVERQIQRFSLNSLSELALSLSLSKIFQLAIETPCPLIYFLLNLNVITLSHSQIRLNY